MYCYQCQETAGNTGCKIRGVCGKDETTSNLQDLLIYTLEGIALYGEMLGEKNFIEDKKYGNFITYALFTTITNANFDEIRISNLIKEGLKLRDELKAKLSPAERSKITHDSTVWEYSKEEDLKKKSETIGILSTKDEDIRSLRSLLLFGIKGMSAYTHHAHVLGYEDSSIYIFLVKALSSLTKNIDKTELINLILKTGEMSVTAMALLDKANTSAYGNPEITKVQIGVRNNPGILISGHDLKDLEELLKQTEGTGVDIYTHSEMLPANYYPAFKKYKHLAGNYGNAWWKQSEEFETFNGPILMTTNCITPVKPSYKDRIFTTGSAGYPGVKHIPDRKDKVAKDFSEIIALAKKSKPPKELEKGEIIGGFAHNQVMAVADKVISLIKSGDIKRFVVMAGCDGRQGSRSYFTEIAENLPKDTIILTAGCAKYRYNKLQLGDIQGVPRVLDAGQCNDSYSLAVIALKLKEVFGLKNINDLPLSFDIAWYEQKAVCVLLALLYLGVKGIRLGPTLPAFLSENVAKILVENFNIKLTGKVAEDIAAIKEGK
ncbi:hydroxylamine reductase [Candidatus Omnitrophus magneticus]|uniref:Hydroxylamine reductase n=1 Tax=Candidatus Omnitrophus magneticus TaxID=1609969 RepID=A0A0F0CV07_9BACT|nr:hydroxylamine reductase [Candidatus Omnitrophus magneticus]